VGDARSFGADPGAAVVSKVFQRSKGEQPARGRNVCDLIAGTIEDPDRTANLVRLIHATTDSLVRLVYATALPVALASIALVLASNGRPQLAGRVGLAGAAVATVAATARVVRNRFRRKKSDKPPDTPTRSRR
jgi:hypothetical protein